MNTIIDNIKKVFKIRNCLLLMRTKKVKDKAFALQKNLKIKKRAKLIRKESLITYLFIFILIGGALGLLYFLDTKMTGFAVYEQTNQVDFDEGTYENTEYNGSAIVLVGNNLSGNYISKVFDAGNEATWNSINLIQKGVTSASDSYLVSAVHLNLNVTEIFALDETYYLADMKDSSKNFYLNFSNNLINNTLLKVYAKQKKSVPIGIYAFSDASGENPLGVLTVVSDLGEWYNILLKIDTPTNKIWIGEGTGSGTDPKDAFDYIYAEIPGSNLSFQVRNCSSQDCSDAEFIAVDLNNINMQSRYFQYKISFSTPDTSITPLVESVSIDYIVLDNSPPNISIISPQNTIYNNSTILVNISASDENLDSIWWNNGSHNITYTNEVYHTFPEGSNTIRAYVNDSFGNENNTLVTFTVNLNSPPLITLVNPQEGVTYGYNESIALDFIASDTDNNLDSCWYNINNGNNIIINNCLNTNFDVSEGNHVLNIFINDTIGEQAEDSVSFSVQVGAPTIILNYPIDEYLNYQENIQFTYTPDDIDLDSCELWGDFTENFELNQTTANPLNGLENTFSLTLSDGDYLWNIKCNDSAGNSAFNGNKTFYVDTLHPTISLIEPIGAKSSRIVTLSWNIIEENPDSCWYNVYRGGNIEITNTSVNCSANSITFDVTIDADFILNFYINDSAGNLASASSSFSVSTSSSEVIIPPSTGGSSSSGGGGGSISIAKNITPILSIDKISNLIVKPSDVKKISWTVKNIGTIFVNDCTLKGLGEYSLWIFADETKDLAAGEEYEFNFNLNIPETISAGEYSLSISLECKEISESGNFIVEIIEKKFGFDLIEVKRDNNENVKIIYSLEELSGIEQNVELQFLLFGVENEKVAEVKDIKKIPANSKQEFEIIIPIDPSLKGELNLLVNLNSETYSTFVQENIILGSPLSGFAIFGERTSTDNALSFFFLILFLIFAFIMIRKIIKLKRKKK